MSIFNKNEAEGDKTDTQKRRLCEEEGVIWPQARGGQGSHQGLEEARNRFSPRAARGSTFVPRFGLPGSRTGREHMSTVLDHPICDNVLRQLQGNTPGVHSSAF